MPIYEYLCEACGRIHELMQKVSDPPPRSCPECGSPKLAKLVSRTAFQLKGGGWYADLYGSSKKGAAKTEAGGAATPDGAKPGAGAKPDVAAKPEAGAEKKAAPAPAAKPGAKGTAE